jgi:hypothetical protein
LAGLLVGLLAAAAWFRRRLATSQMRAEALSTQLAEAGAGQVQLAELRGHLSGLRHDIRGILSPALLVADRLLTHQDAHVRRAGEVMVRTVDRAAARLAETRLDQDADTSDRP